LTRQKTASKQSSVNDSSFISFNEKQQHFANS